MKAHLGLCLIIASVALPLHLAEANCGDKLKKSSFSKVINFGRRSRVSVTAPFNKRSESFIKYQTLNLGEDYAGRCFKAQYRNPPSEEVFFARLCVRDNGTVEEFSVQNALADTVDECESLTKRKIVLNLKGFKVPDPNKQSDLPLGSIRINTEKSLNESHGVVLPDTIDAERDPASDR